MNAQLNQGLGGQYGVCPTSEPNDLHTLRTKLLARAQELKKPLGNVDAHRKELDTIERMLAAMQEAT